MKPSKKMMKQLTGKRDDTALHSAVRAVDLCLVKEILSGANEEELQDLVSKQNQSGETALYVAAECGHIDIVTEMMKFYDISSAGIKARNGYDAFHISAKEGRVDILKVLLGTLPELLMTVDLSNTTALHTAAIQGHIEMVNLLLEADGSLAKIARSNGKTALHSAARNGHLEVIKAILRKEPEIAIRIDKKGQTALHMAVKGQNLEIVEELIEVETSLANMLDSKGNTALHIATRKNRVKTVKRLLEIEDMEIDAVNRSGETALDTAEKAGNSEIMKMLTERGVQTARSIRAPNPARELKQTVSDIKHEVHTQLEHTRQTRKRVRGIVKRISKLHTEGLNNAINSTTVVAVLFATVAFAAIFTLPGEFAGGMNDVLDGFKAGDANISHHFEFAIFLVSDAISLFVSLAVVVVQVSVVVIERRAKKQMMAIMNKLMWLACVMLSVSFFALSFIVVGESGTWLAVGATVIGTVILAATLGTMSYWVIAHRMEEKKLRNLRKSSLSRSRSRSGSRSRSRSRSWSRSGFSDPEMANEEFQKMYAI